MPVKKVTPILICFFLLMACQSETHQDDNKERPNILFIAVDDLRPEFGAYGATHIQASNLDALARQSLIFDRAYCNVPVCGSSRASLLAGMRPGWSRFPGAYNTYLNQDAPDIISLPRHFRHHGYQTFSFGKIYHHANDDTLAWDSIWKPAPRNNSRWLDYQTHENLSLYQSSDSRGLPYERANIPDTAYFDGRIAAQSVATLTALSEQEQPFFLAVGFLKPHLPFNAPAVYWDMYDSTKIGLPASYQRPETTPDRAFHNFGELRHYARVPKEGALSEGLARQLIHGYYASVSYIDAQIGKLMATLEETGLADNTIVILWGDHGWNLGEHQLWCKHCNFETSLHVPLLLRVPGKTHGQHTKNIVEYIDIYPTLTELAGLPQPDHLEGESMVPLLRGETRKKNYAIAKYWSGLTLIKDHWFYTEWINDSAHIQSRMLFDHRNDEAELHNLAEAPSMVDTVDTLSAFLRANWGDAFFSNY